MTTYGLVSEFVAWQISTFSWPCCFMPDALPDALLDDPLLLLTELVPLWAWTLWAWTLWA